MSTSRRSLAVVLSRVASLAALVGSAAGAILLPLPHAAAAQETQPWQVTLAAAEASTAIGVFDEADSTSGFELGIGYRLSPRSGIGLTLLRHDVHETFSFSFFEVWIAQEVSYRPSWLLARYDLHLTPHRHVDLVLSPMAGIVRTGGIEMRTTIGTTDAIAPGDPALTTRTRFSTQEDFAWGARLAMDIPLTRRPTRSSINVGVTYLDSEVEAVLRGEDVEERLSVDLQPVSVHVGYAVRF
jgi:hypothetical protein